MIEKEYYFIIDHNENMLLSSQNCTIFRIALNLKFFNKANSKFMSFMPSFLFFDFLARLHLSLLLAVQCISFLGENIQEQQKINLELQVSTWAVASSKLQGVLQMVQVVRTPSIQSNTFQLLGFWDLLDIIRRLPAIQPETMRQKNICQLGKIL